MCGPETREWPVLHHLYEREGIREFLSFNKTFIVPLTLHQ
uniref:Uncharacterized protein n=1 Tax=Anguilla anguilla TaxID=7936 RepID=A0A0E9QKR7_ANGAN